MKKVIFIIALFFSLQVSRADNQNQISISTLDTELLINVSPNGRIYQSYLGAKLSKEPDKASLFEFQKTSGDSNNPNKIWECYPVSGTEDFFEPAFAIRHNDGNPTSVLYYLSHNVRKIDDNITETTIKLKDNLYPVYVTLHYVTYSKENIFKTWTEISHKEKYPVNISRYASSFLYFSEPSYYLNEFSGDWAKETKMSTQQLSFGKKIIDSKLGTRAAMFAYPFFELGFGNTANENSGKVLMGTIGWTGNFSFTFEVDNMGCLRVISGINPYASDYTLKPSDIFTTPEFIFTLSNQGVGQGSRNFHHWALNYQLKDGKGDRLTLLNNWENTGFDFNEEKIANLCKETKKLGVDMFLLDDGWFGNKYPRIDDHAGLGDWDVTKSKLPHGIPFLVKAAKAEGVKLGIWIEPEMVNPKSELAEKHPDWIISLSKREPYYFRNQLVLDLCNPKVQDYVYSIIDNLMIENPDLAFMKWDCNSPITNIYSPYLKDKQGQLYIDYVRGLYNVMNRVKKNYPNLPLMLCSGGGGRCDYEALKYFTEFWCSDNTDPVERIFIQWGFSHFFPSKSMCAHVTNWSSNTSIKFRVDVAMMCKLGFDINLQSLKEPEMAFCHQAIENYKQLKNVIYNGDLYRLFSPYDGNHSASLYVTENKSLLFAYDIHPRFGEKLFPVKLQGLNPTTMYRLKETNLMSGHDSDFRQNGQLYSGSFLMNIGLDVFTTQQTHSRVIEITAE
jgi:Alpha-galactosidase